MRLRPLALGALLAACTADGPTDAPTSQSLRVSVEAIPNRVARGEVVRFQVTVQNLTDQRIRMTDRCGDPVEVVFAGYSSSLTGASSLACPPEPQQFLDPHASATWGLEWEAPDFQVDLLVVAGIRQAWGLAYRSPSAPLIVR